MKRKVDLRVGSGAKVAFLEQRDYKLTSPSGLVILLRKCYYVSVVSRNIIYVSFLDLDGYFLLLRVI